MKIIITGCCGFIGYHLAKKLLKSGNTVFGIDNINDYYDKKLKHKRLNNLKHKNFHFLLDDINSMSNLKGDFNLLINLAAQPGVRVAREHENNFFETNIKGFKNICDYCVSNQIENVIYASSSSVYEDKTLPFSEKTTALNPKSLYGISKLVNEKISDMYASKYDMRFVGLRFFTVYGPYGRPDMAYYLFTKAIQESKQIKLFNSGKMSRDMTYIDDVVNGIIKTKEYIFNKKTKIKHTIFNIGNEKPVKNSELLRVLENNMNKKANIINMSNEMNESLNTCADLSYAKKILGYNPEVKLEEGITEFLDWYKSYEKKQ